MNAFKNLTAFSCRRRPFTSRICPALLQLLLVLGVWWIIKSHMSSSVEKRDISDQKSVSLADPVNCYPPGFTQAKTFHLLNLSSIISSSKVQDSGSDGNLRHVLRVNVYVHDVSQGSVVMYPAGTILQQDSQNEIKTDEVKKEVDYAYNDNNRDKEDGDNNNFLNYDVNVNNGQLKFSDSSKTFISNNAKEENTNVVRGFPQALVGAGKQFPDYGHGNSELNEAVVERSLAADKHISGNRSGEEKKLVFKPDGTWSDSASGYLHDNANGPGNSNQQMRQDLQNAPQETKAGIFEQQQNVQIVPKNVEQNLQNPLAYSNRQVSSDNQQLKSPEFNLEPANSVGVIPNDNIEPLMVDGFQDRARKFLSELHGANAHYESRDEKLTTLLLKDNSLACRDFREIDLLFLINSKPQSSDMRQRIRDTFVKSTNFEPSVIVHVFLLGRTTSSNFQQILNHEQELYLDIVQGDFLDVPENSTQKGLMGMRWVTQFCPQVKYIMTINDDVFVDTDKLIHGLIPASRKVNNKNLILCYFNSASPIPRSGPNAFGEDIFPGRLQLRPYCKGFAVLMSRGVIFSLLAASEHVRPIPMDELYLYGILPFIAGGIDVYDVGNKRAFHNFGMETLMCYKQKLDKCPFVASIAFSERFTSLWDSVKTRLLGQHQGWEDEKSLWNIPSFIRKF